MNDSPLRRLRDRASSSATLINDGCKVTGVISGRGNVHVSGEIAGDCELEGSLILAKEGFWSGTIRAQDVVIAGRVEGEIVATGKVEITDTARIMGTVTGEAIAVAEGAVVEGAMKTSGPSRPTEFVGKRSDD